MYTGKAVGNSAKVNQGLRVVLKMTEGLMGHIIICDNSLTSFQLAEKLLKEDIGPGWHNSLKQT